MWITPELANCELDQFPWSYPYFNILNEKPLGTQHRIFAVKKAEPKRHDWQRYP
jgi:hypothetical protein